LTQLSSSPATFPEYRRKIFTELAASGFQKSIEMCVVQPLYAKMQNAHQKGGRLNNLKIGESA